MIRTENLVNGDEENNSLTRITKHAKLNIPPRIRRNMCLTSWVAWIASGANLIFILIQEFKLIANMGIINWSATLITLMCLSYSVTIYYRYVVCHRGLT